MLFKSVIASRMARPIAILSRRLLSNVELEAQNLLDEVYASVRAQRFEDIVVIQTRLTGDPKYIILADAFNQRHLVSGTEMVNKHYKNAVRKQGEEFARISISKGWNVIDFNSVVVHLFSKKCRTHFDIEQLWAVGEKYDDLTINGPQEALDWQ